MARPSAPLPTRRTWTTILSLSALSLVALTLWPTSVYPRDALLPPALAPFEDAPSPALLAAAALAAAAATEPLTKEQLRAIVGENPKFLVTASSARYGYNYRRNLFENTMNLAKLTGRIPILPEAIWARGCAVDPAICTEYALEHYEDRNAHVEEMGGVWNEGGEIWKLGIESFLDVVHLRKAYGPALTLSEYLTLFSLPHSLLHPSGEFDTTSHLPSSLSLSTITATEYEHAPLLRVDSFNPAWGNQSVVSEEELKKWMDKIMPEKQSWTMAEARVGMKKAGATLPKGEEAAEAALLKTGLVPLYTFSDWVVANKAAARPQIEYAPFSSLLSLSSLTSLPPHASSDILYFDGNIHDFRKPGSLRFSTAVARDAFARSVQRDIRPPPAVWALAGKVVKKIEEKVKGRRWYAAHLRRGDFVGINWTGENDPITHFELARKCLSAGYAVLGAHFPAKTLPHISDPYYLATDETNTTALAYYRAAGALLLSDLVTPADMNATLGVDASFLDVLSLVEQVVLSRSDYFVGSTMSGETGGAINMRLARGKEEWSWDFIRKW
ncbi:hypothetical protein RQP46_006364 [Phenoliferia psychrophenolica]